MDKKDGNHAFTQQCIDAKHMVQCHVHPEKWLGPGRECVACKAIRLLEERKEKEMAKSNKRQKEEVKVASKANGWDWPEPQPKIKNKLNKVAATPAKGKAGKGKRFTVV